MKTVFKNHQEVCHIFASRSQNEGRAGNMSFRDGGLFSYGTCIRRFCREFHSGQEFLLINDTSYSNSTCKHNGYADRALRNHGLPEFRIGDRKRGEYLEFCNGPGAGGTLHAYARDQAAECLRKSKKARTYKAMHLDRAAFWTQEANRIIEFFSLPLQLATEADLDLLVQQKEEAYREHREQLKEIERRRKETEEQRIERLAPEYEAWKNGANSMHLTDIGRLFPVAFRVEGDELVSTLGARVPLEDARRAYRFVTSKRGRRWVANGESCKVGSYQLDSLTESEIIAGCHHITWAEIERLAPILSDNKTKS